MNLEKFQEKIKSPDFDPEKLSATEKTLYIRLAVINCQRSFKAFCKYIYPKNKWFWFHDLIMDELQTACDMPYGMLIVEMPPQHGKSTLISYLFSAWYLGRFPDRKIANATYGGERAKENCIEVKKIMASQRYKDIFPSRIKSTQGKVTTEDGDALGKRDAAKYFELINSTRGAFKAVGIGESLSGFPADLIAIDDYCKGPDEANSPTYRDSCWEWFTSVALARSQEHGSPILINCTRWHADDLIGRLQKIDRDNADNTALKKWKILTFPAERDREDYEERPYDPRLLGEYLWPGRDQTYIRQKIYNPRTWNALYQQRPPTSEGSVIERHWIKIYSEAPKEFDKIIISVDTSLDARAKQSDDVAIAVYASKGLDIYLLEFVCKRMGYVQTKEILKTYFIPKYSNYYSVIIERKANGPALIEDLQQEFGRIEPYEPVAKKRARFEFVAPLFAGGHVYFPSENLCPNINFAIDQLLEFTGQHPNEKDDFVDVTSQALSRLGKFNHILTESNFQVVKRQKNYQFAQKWNKLMNRQQRGMGARRY